MLAKVFCSLVLCLVIGFLAEPTTSTEVDVRDGRGVVVVDAGAPRVRALAAARTASRLLRTPIAQVVAAAAATVIAGVALARHLRVDGQAPSDPSALAAAARPRRGPPLPA